MLTERKIFYEQLAYIATNKKSVLLFTPFTGFSTPAFLFRARILKSFKFVSALLQLFNHSSTAQVFVTQYKRRQPTTFCFNIKQVCATFVLNAWPMNIERSIDSSG